MKGGSFWEYISFFFFFFFLHSLLCFLLPSFYIPFVLPFSLLTSHVIAPDRFALFVQCPNNKRSQLERDLATIDIHTTTKGRCSTPFYCSAKPPVNQIIQFHYTLHSGKLFAGAYVNSFNPSSFYQQFNCEIVINLYCNTKLRFGLRRCRMP